MIEKFFDNIAKALYDSLSSFDGINKLMITISLLVFALGILAAIYMYKQVQKINEKTLSIMEKHEQVQAVNVKEYQELSRDGMRVLGNVNQTLQEHSSSNKEIVHAIEKNNLLLDVILKKVI